MIKKRHLIVKYIYQIFLYLLEVVGVSNLLAFITTIFWQTENFIDFIERMTIFFTFYQILILGILQQLNDIKKDEYLALISMYKYVELYNESKNDCIKKNIINLLNKQLDSRVLNDNDIRKEYLEIKEVLDSDHAFDDTLLKTKIIKYEHCCEEATLNWKYSILIRILKNW